LRTGGVGPVVDLKDGGGEGPILQDHRDPPPVPHHLLRPLGVVPARRDGLHIIRQ